jgi:uncharacterized protein (TIGR00369 family)
MAEPGPRVYDLKRYLDGVKRFMDDEIPFNKFLGIRAGRIERDFVELILPFRPEFLGNSHKGALHGGVLSTLADTAGGAAVFAAADLGDVVSTIDLRIDYLRPATALEIIAEARVVRMGGRVGVARIQILQGEGESRSLVAEATGVYNVRRQVY